MTESTKRNRGEQERHPSVLITIEEEQKTHILFVGICDVTVVFDRLSLSILSQTKRAVKVVCCLFIAIMMGKSVASSTRKLSLWRGNSNRQN